MKINYNKKINKTRLNRYIKRLNKYLLLIITRKIVLY